MSDLDDVLEMGSMAEAEAELEPVEPVEPEPEPQDQEQGRQAEPEHEATAGGLSEAPEGDPSGPMAVDDLLSVAGVLRPNQREEAQPEVRSREPEAPAEQPVAEESAVDARIKELTERVNRAEKLNERLMDKALGGNEQVGDGPQGEPPRELDPDVLSYFREHLTALGVNPDEIKNLRDTTAPIVERTQRQQLTSLVAEDVPGFEESDIAAVEKFHADLPPEVQSRYTGVGGFIALAHKVKSSSQGGGGQAKQTVSPMASRVVSEAGGNENPAGHGAEDDAALADRIMNLSDEDFAKMDRVFDQ